MAAISVRALGRPNDGKIVILSDADPTTTHPVVQVSFNGTPLSTHVMSGSQVIDGTTYTTTPNASNLTYTPVTTTAGTEYIFDLDVDSLPVTGDDINDGVYTVSYISADEDTSPSVSTGEVIPDDVMCKVAGMLEKAYCGTSKCPPEEVLEKASKIYMLLQGASINAANGDVAAAKCLFNLATSLADNGCGCGC